MGIKKINSALQPFQVMIGKWKTTGTHPYLPNKTIQGKTSFEWIEDGAFIIMHSEIQDEYIPKGVAIFGSDDSKGKYYMIYFDGRGVSRKYNMSIDNKEWKWWRNDPEFSQRFTVAISDDGQSMRSKGEMKKGNSEWEADLSLIYTKQE
jgi:hypothetical protein